MEREGVDLRRLRYFIAVCEHGGFSRASSSIGIAQPSLTRQIKLLEQELGVSLFHRTGRGAGPTSEGRMLLDRSRPHLEGIDEAIREVRLHVCDLSGQFTLGVCPTIAPLFLDDLRADLEAGFPSVHLTVVEAHTGDLASLMAHGSIDMSLTDSPDRPRGVTFVELVREPLMLVTPPGALEHDRPCSLPEIGGLRLILPSAIHELRRIIDAVASRSGIAFRPDIELDSVAAVKSILLSRDARHATILPLNSVHEEVASLRLCRHAIAEPAMHRIISVAVPARSRVPPLTQALTTLVQRRAARLQPIEAGFSH